MPGSLLLFALEQALHLSEPRCLQFRGDAFCLGHWLAEVQKCTVKMGLSPLPEAVLRKQHGSCSDDLPPLGTGVFDFFSSSRVKLRDNPCIPTNQKPARLWLALNTTSVSQQWKLPVQYRP